MAGSGWSHAANLVPAFLSSPFMRGFTPPSTSEPALQWLLQWLRRRRRPVVVIIVGCVLLYLSLPYWPQVWSTYKDDPDTFPRSEAGSGERSTSGDFRAGRPPWAAAAVLPVLRRKMPPEGLARALHRDAVRRSDGAASAVSMPCLQSHRDGRVLAIAMPLDAGTGSTASSPFGRDDLSRRCWRTATLVAH
jgi:hypothetical protein